MDHLAWTQRVDKEKKTTENFHDIAARNLGSFNTPKATNCMLRPYVKENRDLNTKKDSRYFMIDSSYLIPSDPNTMRDGGPARNSEYYFTVGPPGKVSPEKYSSLRKTLTTFEGSGHGAVMGTANFTGRNDYTKYGPNAIFSQSFAGNDSIAKIIKDHKQGQV